MDERRAISLKYLVRASNPCREEDTDEYGMTSSRFQAIATTDSSKHLLPVSRNKRAFLF